MRTPAMRAAARSGQRSTTRASLLALTFALLASPASALPRPDEASPAFVGVPIAGPSVGGARRSVDVHEVVPPLRPDVRDHHRNGVTVRRPVVRVPASPVIVVAVRQPVRHAGVHRGVASWFCGHGSACTHGYSGGLYAAAGPALRVGSWRGRTVVVRAGSHEVRVTLIDWCACPGGRLLDLYSDAFSRLAPLSQGVVKVSVSW